MRELSEQHAAPTRPDPDSPIERHRAYLLARLRCVHLRLRLLLVEIDELGICLKHGFITPDEAARELGAYATLPVYAASILLHDNEEEGL